MSMVVYQSLEMDSFVILRVSKYVILRQDFIFETTRQLQFRQLLIKIRNR